MRYRNISGVFLLNILFFVISFNAKADDNLFAREDAICNSKYWAVCAEVIQNKLNKEPEMKAINVLRLASIWNSAFSKEYQHLRSMNLINNPIAEKDFVEDSLKENLSLYQMSIDLCTDTIIKKYLPRLATILSFASSTTAYSISTFFSTPDMIPADDGLSVKNIELQKTFVNRLDERKKFRSDWKDVLDCVVEDTLTTANQSVRACKNPPKKILPINNRSITIVK